MTKSVVKSTLDPAASNDMPVEGGPWVLGKSYLIRTVTFFVLGRIVAIYERELVLENASWVVDTGRFNECLRSGKLIEVEPFTSLAIVGRGSVTDATEWDHPLPSNVI